MYKHLKHTQSKEAISEYVNLLNEISAKEKELRSLNKIEQSNSALREFVWVDRTGKAWAIHEMETRHLQAICSKYQELADDEDVLDNMLEELNKRSVDTYPAITF
jgi:hypothetical protein